MISGDVAQLRTGLSLHSDRTEPSRCDLGPHLGKWRLPNGRLSNAKKVAILRLGPDVFHLFLFSWSGARVYEEVECNPSFQTNSYNMSSYQESTSLINTATPSESAAPARTTKRRAESCDPGVFDLFSSLYGPGTLKPPLLKRTISASCLIIRDDAIEFIDQHVYLW